MITTAERARMAFEELGPTFVKLGQLLSTRPNLIDLYLDLQSNHLTQMCGETKREFNEIQCCQKRKRQLCMWPTVYFLCV